VIGPTISTEGIIVAEVLMSSSVVVGAARLQGGVVATGGQWAGPEGRSYGGWRRREGGGRRGATGGGGGDGPRTEVGARKKKHGGGGRALPVLHDGSRSRVTLHKTDDHPSRFVWFYDKQIFFDFSIF
jgi:hypothetical protein